MPKIHFSDFRKIFRFCITSVQIDLERKIIYQNLEQNESIKIKDFIRMY